MVIFGASGDLTARKILPALARLADRGVLDDGFTVIGVARTEWTDDEFRAHVAEATPDGGPKWKALTERFKYITGEYDHPDTFDQLKTHLDEADQVDGTDGNRLYYLATIPSVFGLVAGALATTPAPGRPTGRLASSGWWWRSPTGATWTAPSPSTSRCTPPSTRRQIYRIDHYMGKETVQNVLALRFANAIFEPIWNRRYVEQVQVTVAESLGVEHRGGFYETAGALRDIVQNHVMQVLALTLMESPTSTDADRIRDEKVKLLQAIDIPTPDEAVDKSVRGQYTAGHHRRREGRSATARSRTSPPTARPRPTWPSGCGWRTGGGPGCPSTSAPASGCRPGSPRWPSPSARCRSSSSTTGPAATCGPTP